MSIFNDKPAIDLSEASLSSAVGENLFALFRAMAGNLPGGEIVESPKLCKHHTFPTNPMFKGVWASNLSEEEVALAIIETIDWFRSRNAPYFFWWTTTLTRPSSLGAALARHGMIAMEEQQKVLAHGVLSSANGAPGMVAELDRMNESVMEMTPPGFEIVRVSTRQELDEFKRIFVEVYAIPEWAGQAWVDATNEIGIDKSPWQIYLGLLNGKPVATNMLFCGAGVASVYAVASLAEVRGKGIGGAVTLGPLLEARREGYRYGVLFSTDMGVNAYQRIGFRLTDFRIDRYLWRG